MIGSSDFPAFFEALNGVPPFPWQERLARQVVERESWPEILALPTAAGKTAVVDVAIFALAFQADRPASERTAPLRTVFVVDRRVVVDETYERARQLAERLSRAIEDGEGGVVGEVARRLAQIGRRGLPEDAKDRNAPPPLEVGALRGGIYRDRPWARSPAQPIVCVSTVGQVGSRLLFRPYGLSSYAAPIHAGLLGNDVLFILDEAHLSRPFEETLRAIQRYRGWAESAIRSPFRVVTMTATPSSRGKSFELDDSDRSHPILSRRLNARKDAELPDQISDASDEGADEDPFAIALAQKAIEFARSDPDAQVIGIVANRVGTARAVHRRLLAQAAGESILLTGRARPYDRDRLIDGWWPRIRAGRARTEKADRPLFVVATQCIEVGANIDFDALVTECASLDALRQRFGRLDRLGERGTSRAAILARRSSLSSRDPDRIYGVALAETWEWLRDSAERREGRKAKRRIDMGIASLEARLADHPPEAPCFPERGDAPVMLPGHLDLFVRTSPIPAVDPDPAPFMHGPETGPRTWRSCGAPTWVPILPNGSISSPSSRRRARKPFPSPSARCGAGWPEIRAAG